MIPTHIPRYSPAFYGSDQPRQVIFKHQKDPYGIDVRRRKPEINIPSPMSSIVQPDPMNKTLCAHRTPFDLKKDLQKLGGLFNGLGKQSGRPIRVQDGLSFENLPPKKPLHNT